MRYLILFLCCFLLSCSASKKAKKLLLGGEIRQENFLEKISFEDFNDWIVVKVKFHGLDGEYDFLLDTGAPNVVSPALAKQLNLKPVTKDVVGSSNSRSQKTVFSIVDTIYIGDLAFSNSGVLIIDFDRSPDMICLGKKIDGIIGSNLMRKAIWNINYQEQSIIITDDSSKVLTTDQIVIPFKPKTQGTPTINASIKDLDFRLTIDTGKKKGIDLKTKQYKKAVRPIDSVATVKGFGVISSGIFGLERDTLIKAKIPQMKIHNYELDTTILSIKDNASNLVGNEFLSQFIVTINWLNNKIYLSPTNEYKKEEEKSFGFGYEYRDKNFFVSFLYENGSAIKEGLQIGDQLLSVDDVKLDNATIDQFCSFKNDGITNENQNNINLVVKREESILNFTLQKEAIFK